MKMHQCPICSIPLDVSERYPNYVCGDCSLRASDEKGKKLAFSNTSLSGGFIAFYPDNGEEYTSHTCYIDGIKCYADEHRFGGIVIQPINEKEGKH